MYRSMLIVGFALIGGAACVQAAESRSEAQGQAIESKFSECETCCGAALTINFANELGLPLDYLTSIGYRIAQARRAPDPVDLALAAQGLAAAEKASGKTASVTAAHVMKDALDLARLRGNSSELATLSQLATDDATKKDLAKQLAAAKRREADQKAAAKSDEETRELIGHLTVANHFHECLRIYVSGRYVGTVHSGETMPFYVHDHNDSTLLDAYCEDGHLVRRECVWGHHHSFFWHIY